MPGDIRYRSAEELEELKLVDALKQRDAQGDYLGGIVYREGGYVYIANPYRERPVVVKLETEASEDDITAIREEIIPMRESYEILEAMAVTYKLRQPLLLEGPTAVGKTFMAEKFTELLYGRGNKPLEFYCTGQTDVSELTAKWVPRTTSEDDKRRWEEFLESPEAREKISEIARKAEESQDAPERKLASIHNRIKKMAEEAGFAEGTQWSIQYGAMPVAMGYARNAEGSIVCDETGGTGFLLHIEEVGLAEPQIINVLLQLRGKRGRLAESMRLWESGGRDIRGGPRFWLVFSTNPPEDYYSRNELDPALARGVVFKRVGELSEESLKLAAKRIFSGRQHPAGSEPGPGCILNIYEHPELCGEVAQLMAILHLDFDKAIRSGEKGRHQRIPLTLDDMARVSDYLLSMQSRDEESGYLDLVETLERAISFYYLDRLADAGLKKDLQDNVNLTLAGPLGQKRFRGSMRARKEILDILVEEASMTAGELQEQEGQDSERAMSEFNQARYDFEDKVQELLQNPKIPEEIKKQLSGTVVRKK